MKKFSSSVLSVSLSEIPAELLMKRARTSSAGVHSTTVCGF